MDYNKLKTFAVVAEYNSFSKAAQILLRSQSAISQQIQILESELGFKLIERASGKIYLSPEGNQLYETARTYLGNIDEVYQGIRKSFQTVEGHIRLGVLHNYGTDFNFGKSVGSFCQKYSKITFSITEGTTEHIEELLIENKIDLGLLVTFKNPELFIKNPVVESTHSLYTTKKYLKKINKENLKSFKEIMDCALIDLKADFPCITPYLVKNSKSSLNALKHRMPNAIVPNLFIAKEMILSGYGVGSLSDFLVEKELKQGSIIKLFPNAKPTKGILDVAYRTNHNLRACEKLFIENITSP